MLMALFVKGDFFMEGDIMKKLRRIISMAMVLVLFIGILPMNLGLVKAEAELDETTKLKNIKVRAFNSETDTWDDIGLTIKEYVGSKPDIIYTPIEFSPDIRLYQIKLDPKYKKIQFYIEKASEEQVVEIESGFAYKVRNSNYTEETALEPGKNTFKFFVIPSNGSATREHVFSIERGDVTKDRAKIHKLSVTNGSAEFYEAYEGDVVKIWAINKYKMVFDKWVIEDGNNIIKIEDGNSIIKEPDKTPTELIMPNTILTIKPTFKESIVNDSNVRDIVLYGLEDEVWKNQKSKLAFKKEQKAYTVDLSDDFSIAYLYFQFGDSKQSISVTLNNNVVASSKAYMPNGYETEKIKLNEGENTFKITVTSQDGTNTSVYTLIVNKGNVKYKVSLVPGEGKGENIVKDFAKGSTYTLPDCTFEAPENKEFKAWSVNNEEKAVGDEITINEDIEVTATWRDNPIEKYKVTLVANNDTGKTIVKEVKKGTDYTLPDCKFTAPEGQVFKAWKIGDKEYNPQEKITIDEATIIKAIWQDKPNPDKPNPDKPNQKHAINITPSPYGEVIIDPLEAKAGDKVTVRAIAKYGYELVSLSVHDASGKLLPIINGEFIMPDGEVDIYPIFREIAPYIEPEIDDKAEREEQKRRARRNYYHEEENDEDEVKTIDKAKEEKQKESKVLITIGSEILDKVDNGVRTLKAMDAKPYIKGGRTMLPLRYVAEALGYRVAWLSETRTAVIMDIGLRVEIPVDSSFIIVNGVKYTSDVKPEMRNNRIMLPIANIARALGLKDGKDILWDEANRQVTLIRNFNTK